MSRKKRKQRKKYPLSSNSSRKKTRNKTRKPKFLSLLRLQLRRVHDAADSECTPSPESSEHSTRQLNLFPLESDNLVEFEDKDDHQYDNVSELLLNPTDNSDDATLNGLLNENGPPTSDDGPPASSYSSTSLPCVYGGRGGSLVWAAMKGRERREESQERWVKYSEESSSCYGGGEEEDDGGSGRLLDLKLDHEEILKTWGDKGPLFIGGEAPHEIVPDLPTSLIAASHMGLVKDEGKGHREASVLRYKEKRRSRLFSKCIRYQVRKINAEKRHRSKGRFVKR